MMCSFNTNCTEMKHILPDSAATSTQYLNKYRYSVNVKRGDTSVITLHMPILYSRHYIQIK